MGKVFCFALVLYSLFCLSVNSQGIIASDGGKNIFVYKPASISGIDNIFIFFGMQDATLTFSSPTDFNPAGVRWFSYQDDPTNRTELTGVVEDGKAVLKNIQSGFGYIVNDNGIEQAVWVFDYANYQPVFEKLEPSENQLDECEYLLLSLTAAIPEFTFCGFSTGNVMNIYRDYKICYESQKWVSNEGLFETIDVETIVNELSTDLNAIRVTPPLIDTYFTLTDSISHYFGIEKTVISDNYEAVAVEAYPVAELVSRDANENEKDRPTIGEGKYIGSSPIEVNFSANASSAARHFSWEFSAREDFDVLMASYPDENLFYSFENAGTYYVRLVTSDYANKCPVTSDAFVFQVTESSLEAPNFFTPNSSSGINDEFKVVYTSISKFKCSIFNRWGSLIYQYSDPAGGWDGKKNGKLVPPGVYFYVIEAKGSDGIDYSLKGDINLLYSRDYMGETTESNE